MLVKFVEHKFKKIGKYKCEKCGYRFRRTFSNFWTENPFNRRFIEEGKDACDKRCREEIEDQMRQEDCPKCGASCYNI